jgi:2'-5' RNA ligase
MGFAVELYLDGESDRRVRALWRMLAEAGAGSRAEHGGAAPHVSLATFEHVDHPHAVAALSRFVESCEPLTISFNSVGSFQSPERVIFLAPARDESLLATHAEFHGFLRSMALESSALYAPGRWVPHCTLAQRVPADAFEAVLRKAQDALVPFDATLLEIGLVELQPLRTLWRRSLVA